MELFFIIFAVIFWAIKFSVEKYNTEKYNQIKESQSHLQNQMHLRLKASKEMTDKVLSDVYDTYNQGDIIKLLSNELTAIYGQDYKAKINIHKTEASIQYIDDGYWICQLLLARQGKVGICEVISGYYLGDSSFAQRNIKYCQQIEKLLRENVTIGNAFIRLYLTPKRYSMKEDYQYPTSMNSMNFLFNLQQYITEDIATKGSVW